MKKMVAGAFVLALAALPLSSNADEGAAAPLAQP
jgi:hypothetical protein